MTTPSLQHTLCPSSTFKTYLPLAKKKGFFFFLVTITGLISAGFLTQKHSNRKSTFSHGTKILRKLTRSLTCCESHAVGFPGGVQVLEGFFNSLDLMEKKIVMAHKPMAKQTH